jgi:multidrug efflux system membrane fusion protein
VVRIPTSALVFRERGMEVAIVGPGDRIELKPITIGRNLGTEVEVLTGLGPAERLVNSPPDSLATGDVVRIAASPSPTNADVEHPGSPGGQAAVPELKRH